VLSVEAPSHPYRDDESLVSKALYELHQQQEQQTKRTTAFQ
jgi:hypothetical protein